MLPDELDEVLDDLGLRHVAGVDHQGIVGCLIAVLPAVGVARVVSAAPKVGLALGYDLERALESHDPAGDART